MLIYFSPQQAVEISTALAGRLAADGVLFLGHAEATLATNPSLWQSMPRVLPTEFAQLMQVPLPAPYAPLELPPLPARAALPRPMTPTPAAMPDEQDAVAHIRELADGGAYEKAEKVCREMIARDPTSARLHFYDAMLRQVSDDLPGAESALRRALYLDRNFVLAHHRLGMLLLSLGRTTEARRALTAASRLAAAAAPDELLQEGRGVSAGDLSAALLAQLAGIGEAA